VDISNEIRIHDRRRSPPHSGSRNAKQAFGSRIRRILAESEMEPTHLKSNRSARVTGGRLAI
jgi:hypothetical protein